MAKSKRKLVYFFGGGKATGKGHQRELLGGKGAGLAEMTNIGLPVPAGFTITSECCSAYHDKGGKWPAGLENEIKKAMQRLERVCKKKFGDPKDPLLVSVRSGAAVSMPGMMETILNLGLNDRSVDGMAAASGSRRFALDAYRRLNMMYGSTAKGIHREIFDDEFERIKNDYARPRLGKSEDQKVLDIEVNEEELLSLINRYKHIYKEHTGEGFPQAPFDQLVGAINAVFESWNADKAVTYRRVEKITGLTGTAVNVMQMVFGNMGDDSGTGVCFTRDPSTGDNEFYGDLLINAQGEDVVSGARTPIKLSELQRLMPDIYDQLEAMRIMLEVHYKEMQDLEFTIERGKLYMLQCRTGKRSPRAAIKVAVDQATRAVAPRSSINRLVKKKHLARSYAKQAGGPVITKEQAICRITPDVLERLFYPIIDPDFPREQLEDRFFAQGNNAVPGAAGGKVTFNAARAEEMAGDGENVILVRKETNPEDVGGMHVAKGILTATGGKTSHAAVVARGWGKCCIVGCEALRIDYNQRHMTVDGTTVSEGDVITLDGSDGRVYIGEVPLSAPEMPEEYHVLMGWCDQLRRLKVRTNADTPKDASKAVDMGAEGIGLCRTEHMFFETEERRLAIQQMIMSGDEQDRRSALDKLLPYQRDDFVGIFEAMDGKPVTVRLLDPPLHEFLPKTEEDREKLHRATGIDTETLEQRAEQMHESNPMLGHRGCRLCVTFPEILEMQVTAIIEAAIVSRRNGIRVLPEIMIPLSIDDRELGLLAQRTREVAQGILDEAGEELDYLVGTMIETPRAAILGDRLAGVVDFFSFGTNDLTQTTMALSRDDAGRFLPVYIDPRQTGIFKTDPFQSLDVDGVGQLIRWGLERGRSEKPKLKVGICGEHGGDAESVYFCHEVGMDYVSCSPYRVPIARLAAAQAVILEGEDKRSGRSATARRQTAKVKPKSNQASTGRKSKRQAGKKRPKTVKSRKSKKKTRASKKRKKSPSARSRKRRKKKS